MFWVFFTLMDASVAKDIGGGFSRIGCPVYDWFNFVSFFSDRSSRIPVLPYIWSAGSWRPVLPGLPFLSYIYSEGSWHNARPSTAAHVAAAQGRSSALRCAGAPEVYGVTCHMRRVASCVAPLLCSVFLLKRRGGSGVTGIWPDN